MAKNWRAWLGYALAWIPLMVMYGLVLRLYGDAGPRSAAFMAVSAMGSAALLGVGVWWVSGRIPWPERRRAAFYGIQLVLSLAYSVLWTATTGLRVELLEGLRMAYVNSGPPIYLGWRLLTGVWLYGILAGISYSIRVHRRLREQQVAAARAEALAARAQLQTLRAQLNPHFLFNALHTLTTLVRHDPTVAERALEQLGDVLRYALDQNGLDDVTFADEWSVVDTYLEIEKLRLGSRLRIETDIDPDALDCLVPPFLLQPLVENAVRHAIARRAKGGTLSISAALADSSLVLRVSDDGPGTTLAAVLDAPGFGIRSVGQRLEARYGERASFEIDTAPGAGFRAVLRIPATALVPEALEVVPR